MHARPSPLAESDHETATEAAAANKTHVVDLEESEVGRSIDVIPEVTPASSVSGSPMLGSSERTGTPLLTETSAGHSSTPV